MEYKYKKGDWIRIGTFVVIGILLLLVRPLDTKNLTSKPKPIASYDQAVKKVQEIEARDNTEVNPICNSKFLSHYKKTKYVIVLIHGYTNCPEQFMNLGGELYNRNANVLIVRMPHQGLKDRMNIEQGKTTAEELVDYTDEVIDVAHGLGEKVIVVGLSGGGVISGWVAQNRADVEQAVLLAPNFGYIYPDYLSLPITNFLLTAPNAFRFWDDKNRENAPGPNYGYTRYSTKVIGEFFRLGFAVREKAKTTAPYAKHITVVTNANDVSVSNSLIQKLVADWRKKNAKVDTYEFPKNLKLIHDIIDPHQVEQKTDIVYPKLLELTEHE